MNSLRMINPSSAPGQADPPIKAAPSRHAISLRKAVGRTTLFETTMMSFHTSTRWSRRAARTLLAVVLFAVDRSDQRAGDNGGKAAGRDQSDEPTCFRETGRRCPGREKRSDCGICRERNNRSRPGEEPGANRERQDQRHTGAA